MSTRLTLPPLEIRPVKQALGNIYHVIDQGGPRDVVRIDEIRLSARRRGELYKLSDGQSIIVTSHKNVNRPDHIDGVLRTQSDGRFEWLSHRLLDEFQTIISNNEWDKLKRDIESSC